MASRGLLVAAALLGGCGEQLPAETESSTSSSDTGNAPTGTPPTTLVTTGEPDTTDSPDTIDLPTTTPTTATVTTATVTTVEPPDTEDTLVTITSEGPSETDTTTTTTTGDTTTTTGDTDTTTTTGDTTTGTTDDTDTTTGVVQMFTPLSLEVADFDADGASDLLVLGTDNIEGTVGRLSRGVGDGTFLPPVDPGLSGESAFPVIGELDDTPGVDVMIAQTGGDVGVFRWTGDSFSPWQTFNNDNAPLTHVIADAEGDDDQDILWLWWTKDLLDFGVSVRPNGGGLFLAPVDTKIGVIADVGLAPGSLVVGDFNGDSISDVLIFESNQKKGFLRLLGSPAGVFGSPKFFALEVKPWVAWAGDFDEDGDLDIITVERDPARLVLVRGDGLGGFKFVGGSAIAAPFQPFTLTVADLNGDQHLDIAVVDADSPELRVWSGKGDATFSGPSSTVLPSPAVRVHAARLDGDDKFDLALATFAAGDVTIVLSP